MAFPIKLGREDGQRRLELLRHVSKEKGLATVSLETKLEREDLRWLWRANLIAAVSAKPLMFGLTEVGRRALRTAPDEFARLAKKEVAV